MKCEILKACVDRCKCANEFMNSYKMHLCKVAGNGDKPNVQKNENIYQRKKQKKKKNNKFSHLHVVGNGNGNRKLKYTRFITLKAKFIFGQNFTFVFRQINIMTVI